MSYPFTTSTGIAYTAGKYNNCVQTGSATQAGSVLPSTTTFTVDAWVLKSTSGTHVALGQAGAFWLGTNSGTTAFAQYGNGGPAVNLTTTVNISDGAWHHLRLAISSSGATFLVDGAVAATSATTPATAGVTAANVLELRQLSGSFGWPSLVDECAIWTTTLSSAFTPAELSNSAANLRAIWKFNGDLTDTAVAALAFSTQPTAATVTAGATASFGTVVATGGTPAYAYQWQRSTDTGTTWANVATGTGGTTATYTTAATTVTGGSANNADQYRCVVTDAVPASVNSNAVVLTVNSSSATAVTMTGPTTGTVSAASSNFTVGANGIITGTVVVTPSDSAGGGTFTPTTVSISSGTPTATFTYTAASIGAKTISVTNNGSLTNPASITYTASAAALYTRIDATEPLTGQAIMVLVPGAGATNPYNSANPTKTIIYVHGHGETAGALLADSLKSSCVTALLNAGYILADCAAGGSVWGIQSATDGYAGLDSYLRANYNVAGIGLWSQSMGGLSGLHALVQAKVRGVVGWLGTYPVCNLANLYGLGVYTSVINTQYGITGTGTATYANKTYGMDPVLHAARDFRDTPMRFYSSRSDTVVPGLNNAEVLQALVASSRREAVLVQCTGNHGDTSHFVPSEYVAFFDRCFAAPVTPTTRTVTLTLTSDGTTPRANLTGLKWAFWDQATPNLLLAPVVTGTGATTNASGVLSVSVPTTLAVAGVGWLLVTDSDGTTAQSPAAKAFSGPVVVS